MLTNTEHFWDLEMTMAVNEQLSKTSIILKNCTAIFYLNLGHQTSHPASEVDWGEKVMLTDSTPQDLICMLIPMKIPLYWFIQTI
jgi:hypothetical protein